jgi:hypothetical protein
MVESGLFLMVWCQFCCSGSHTQKGENKGPGRTEEWPTFDVEVSDSEIDSESVDTVVLVASLKRHSDPKRKKVCPDLRMSSRQILGV